MQRREAGLGGRLGDSGPAHACADAGAAGGHVDLDLLEGVGADEQRVLEAVQHRTGVVASALRRDAQAALACVADRLRHVVGAGYADHRGRALVMKEVERLAGGVKGLVRVGEDLAVES